MLALIAAGSVFVHELRYIAAYGGTASQALAEQGHSYMPLLEALVALLVLITLARFAMSLWSARGGSLVECDASTLVRQWVGATAALLAVYTAQEGFEGAFAPGHPSGLIGVFGNGGWTAVIFSGIVGLAIAALARRADQAIELVAARSAAAHPQARSTRRPWSVLCIPAPRRLDVLARHLAGRAPPPHLV